ncbi:MAG: deoxyribodipyrimidine photolyase, partial [Desulfatiglandales bacterium]
MEKVPSIRITQCNQAPINLRGSYILYWMTSFRRTGYNYALQRAVEWAEELKRPLLVLEALRSDYLWANERIHAFILQGMWDNWEGFRRNGVTYYPYVEKRKGEGKGLLKALSGSACLVVTDHFPCFFIPRMLKRAQEILGVRLEQVDSNGILPLRLLEKAPEQAYAFRRICHERLLEYLGERPLADPLKGRPLPRGTKIPEEVANRWPALEEGELKSPAKLLIGIGLNQKASISPMKGGRNEGLRQLEEFLRIRLFRYGKRNNPDSGVESGLSPYLHFGHLSAHEVVEKVLRAGNWGADRVNLHKKGKNIGWWGLDQNIEAFLDQIITWRELGYQFCHKRPDYASYDSIPLWARQSLERHLRDP